jgi:hypothetical protein
MIKNIIFFFEALFSITLFLVAGKFFIDNII